MRDWSACKSLIGGWLWWDLPRSKSYGKQLKEGSGKNFDDKWEIPRGSFQAVIVMMMRYDEVIFVSHAPGRSEGALNPWYPHFTPFRVIYFVYAHPCSLMRLSHHAFLLVSPWKRFLGDVPPHLLRECTGHRTEQNRTERGPRFVTDLCILFQFFFKDKQPVTLIWQCRFCRNVVFKECSSFIVCLKECWTSFWEENIWLKRQSTCSIIIGPVNY